MSSIHDLNNVEYDHFLPRNRRSKQNDGKEKKKPWYFSYLVTAAILLFFTGLMDRGGNKPPSVDKHQFKNAEGSDDDGTQEAWSDDELYQDDVFGIFGTDVGDDDMFLDQDPNPSPSWSPTITHIENFVIIKPDTKTPNTKTPNSEVFHTKTPDTKTYDTNTPDTKSPNTSTHYTKSPNTSTLDIKNPDAKTFHDQTNFKYLHHPIAASYTQSRSSVISSVEIKGVTTGVSIGVNPLSEAEVNKRGKFKFYDDFGERPAPNYADFVGGDVPLSEFGTESWQADAVYVNHFLDEAMKLIGRTRNAIYEEYGFPASGTSADRDTAFGFRVLPEWNPKSMNIGLTNVDGGTYPMVTSEKKFDGLIRRLLHAMMTNEEFRVSMGGHSAAAGHGNNFYQSYMHQFHHVMEPIFTRLGMKLRTANFGRGGLGTFQDTLAGTDTYGDPDILVWDSGMTEDGKSGAADAFSRQAILAGTRVPFLINHGWFSDTGADFAYIDILSMEGFPVTPQDEKKRKKIPAPAQYLKCETSEMNCKSPNIRFNSQCWIDTKDFTPPKNQLKVCGGRASWHPGWREHQFAGRRLSLLVLEGLEKAVELWQEKIASEGCPLDGKYWHVSKHYDQIRETTMKSVEDSACFKWLATYGLEIVCGTPMHGKTEFTPRANPDYTSLRSIVRPAANGYIPEFTTQVVYDKPIVFPDQEVPKGGVDVRAIAGSRRLDNSGIHTTLSKTYRKVFGTYNNHYKYNYSSAKLRALENVLTPGLGWEIYAHTSVGVCDGTTEHYSCKRSADNDCLGYDHHDSRGGIYGDGTSGWIIFDLKNVIVGRIVMKLETWHHEELVRKKGARKYKKRQRGLKVTGVDHWPDDVILDYAIDGHIKSLDKAKLKKEIYQPQRVVQLLNLLNKKPNKPKDIEVAVRLRCPTSKGACYVNINHMYWA